MVQISVLCINEKNVNWACENGVEFLVDSEFMEQASLTRWMELGNVAMSFS
jgi:hypothetical protein